MDDYERRCAEFAGDDALPAWIQLRSVLLPRRDRGWRFESDANTGHGTEPLWCFGLGGTALLVANVDGATLHLYAHSGDQDLYFSTIEGFRAGLPSLEEKHRGLTPLQAEILADNAVGLETEMLVRLQAELQRQDSALDEPN